VEEPGFIPASTAQEPQGFSPGADLRLKNADERQTKVRLAVALNSILDARKLSQVEAAK
jgi:hypothetical protein